MTAATRNPSVPASWGGWPPEQARLDHAAARALGAVSRIVAKLAPDNDPVIEVWLDPPGAFAFTCFGPGAESVAIGSVLVPVLGLGWLILWRPATDDGKLWSHDARFDFEQERLRDRTRRRRVW
jgi:hypothetical protein